MKFVRCLLFSIFTFTDADDMIQQRCNKEPLCFLCGCKDESDESVFDISCGENHVIQMEPDGHVMREVDSDSDNCPLDSYRRCNRNSPTTRSTLQDRIEVYKNCTLKNICVINRGRIQTGKKRLVNYPFYCHDKIQIHDISSKRELKLKNPIFYFTGEKYIGQKIDCDCSVTGSTPTRLEMFFIYLKPSSCSKVKFLSETRQLFGCSTNDTTVLHIRYYYIGADFKLEIRGMEPDVEDVLFFRVWGNNLAVNCSGCTNSSDDGLTTDPDPSTTDPTTTEHLTLDSPVQAASTYQTNSAVTATLGGILAAVIIINIVGIALYCLIRRRKKQHKSQNTPKNAPGNGDQTQYNYIDITPDTHGSSSSNRTESNVVQSGEQRKHSVNALENIPKTIGSKDRPNNQYHVLEVDSYSEPAYTRADADAKHVPGKERRKEDDYDHIHDGYKSKPTNNDNYNHIDAKMAEPRDDYNHIGGQNGLSKHKLKPKEKNQVSGNEDTSYVNVNLETNETPLSTEDVDTYNHLQN